MFDINSLTFEEKRLYLNLINGLQTPIDIIEELKQKVDKSLSKNIDFAKLQNYEELIEAISQISKIDINLQYFSKNKKWILQNEIKSYIDSNNVDFLIKNFRYEMASLEDLEEFYIKYIFNRKKVFEELRFLRRDISDKNLANIFLLTNSNLEKFLTYSKNKRFIRNDIIDIVYDTKTNLIWADDIDCQIKKMNREDAKRYASTLRLGGFSDWRLPTIEELKTLIDKSHKPTIDPIFKNIQSSYYWCSNDGYTWHVDFSYGGDHWDDMNNSHYFRCVRLGQ